MKIFVLAITFFKTYFYVTRVEDCKLDEIGVKISLLPLIVIASPKPCTVWCSGRRAWQSGFEIAASLPLLAMTCWD
jgi:hypothetical protein